MSPAKWNALERKAAERYLRAVPAEITTREPSTISATAMTAKTYQPPSSDSAPSREPPDGLDDDEHAAAGEDRGLAERAEILGAAVPVGVIRVGQGARQADGEEGQDRRDDVAGGLDARGDEGEAAGEQAGPELEDHQQRGRGDREQRRPRLAHGVRGALRARRDERVVCGHRLRVGGGACAGVPRLQRSAEHGAVHLASPTGTGPVGVLAQSASACAAQLLTIQAWASQHGVEVVDLGTSAEPAGLDPGCRLVIALGGDGTILRALQVAMVEHAAVLGVNFGHVGFLADIHGDELGPALERLARGEALLDERTALVAEIGESPPAG